MPIYMDRHFVEGATHHAVANAHGKDLAAQRQHGVKFLTYWFDEARCTAFCLVDAPNKEAIQNAHNEAHGLVPNEIIEVDPGVVEAFLGRVKDPPAGAIAPVPIDSAFRAIMFTDLMDSTAMTIRLGEMKAMHLLRVHNTFVRTALHAHSGREVKHLGDGVMAAFTSATKAIDCAIAMQNTFASYNAEGGETPLRIRIGLNAGEPVAEDNDLFGATVQLGARICAHAKPDQILAAAVVVEEYPGAKSLFTQMTMMTPKGFDQPVEVYDVHWR